MANLIVTLTFVDSTCLKSNKKSFHRNFQLWFVNKTVKFNFLACKVMVYRTQFLHALFSRQKLWYWSNDNKTAFQISTKCHFHSNIALFYVCFDGQYVIPLQQKRFFITKMQKKIPRLYCVDCFHSNVELNRWTWFI